MTHTWALSGDLPPSVVAVACALCAFSVLMLGWELRHGRGSTGRRRPLGVLVSGAVGLLALLLAVLRPVQVEARGSVLGARVVVLVDASRSIDLPAGEGQGTRRQLLGRALERLAQRLRAVRVQAYSFGKGPPALLASWPVRLAGDGSGFDALPELGSDLTEALEGIAASNEERPQAVLVLSDGRLDRPGPSEPGAEVRAALGRLNVPVHTVSLGRFEPRDAAVRAVHMADAVVAHQPAQVTVEIGCTGGLGCSSVPVVARELRPDGPPIVRASASAHVEAGSATVGLELVLDQAGRRIVEIAIDAPEGDTIPENDRRLLTVDVTRDRVRLLHIAGRPTYDVRALRTWLKSDASVDLVAFFILRTLSDHLNASQDEMALIPFPVNELFTVHLASFDAVILQDFDAAQYDLLPHLPAIARYVRGGGGLILVGGENAFVSGHYNRKPLDSVLPVALDKIDVQGAVDYASFVPVYTDAGRSAPVLQPLRALLGDDLPEMPGVNVLGDARPNSTVLWVHPWLRTASGAPMPVLALGEYGNGRTIALAVDGSHKLQLSTFAQRAAGRAHGAFWDALLGWLMRDPRFEPAVAELPDGCIAGRPVTLLLRPLFGAGAGSTPGRATLELGEMGTGQRLSEREIEIPAGDRAVPVDLGPLKPGGYALTVRLEREGSSAPSRYEFACEAGGPEWADPRPDAERLARIAKSTGGVAAEGPELDAIPVPEAALVVSERSVLPLWPPWRWALLAALGLGVHWVARRRSGLG